MTAMQTASTTTCIPAALTVRECESYGIKVAKAQFDALKCADTTYSQAGVSFEQDGRFTKAKYDGMTVASLIGRFSKQLLIECIRSNIADHASWVAKDIMPVLNRSLRLPEGHVLRLQLDPNLDEIKRRGSNKLSVYVGSTTATPYDMTQLYAELRIFLNECKATLIIKNGDSLGTGDSLLQDGEDRMYAETYQELGEQIAQTFNTAVERSGIQH